MIDYPDFLEVSLFRSSRHCTIVPIRAHQKEIKSQKTIGFILNGSTGTNVLRAIWARGRRTVKTRNNIINEKRWGYFLLKDIYTLLLSAIVTIYEVSKNSYKWIW